MHKGYSFIVDSAITVIAYDVSIEDIDERKKQSTLFKTLKIAEQKLGVGQNALKTALKNRGRVFSPLMQKEYAIRFKSKKQ